MAALLVSSKECRFAGSADSVACARHATLFPRQRRQCLRTPPHAPNDSLFIQRSWQVLANVEIQLLLSQWTVASDQIRICRPFYETGRPVLLDTLAR
jgi:hypothetical protein